MHNNDSFTRNACLYTNAGTNTGEDVIRNVHAELYNTAELNTSRTSVVQTWPSIEQGGVEEITWFLEVPKIVTVATRYQPIVRACYAYQTEAWRDIFIADRNWAERLPSLGLYSSTSPVSISFSWSGSYVPITGTSTNVKVTVTKDADGFIANAYNSPNSFGDRDTITNLTVWWGNPKSVDVTVSSEGDFDSCAVEGDTTRCVITDSNKLKLFNQKERSYNIFLSIKDMDDDGNYADTLKMYSTVYYKFCVYSNPLIINVQPQIQ
ncbi:MAG: hypothetical protein PHI86_07920 [Candidatus Omnitrophica bacterium]|nr:hypothetical protein [Candidatus Omnitrophota bacterium]